MRTVRLMIAGFASLLATVSVYASESPKAIDISKIVGLPITNSILTSWVISLAIILLVRFLVKTPQLMPSRGQGFVEVIVEGIIGVIEPVVGKRMVKPTFWLLSGLFMYIAFHNWSGLLPGVGTIGEVVTHNGVTHVVTPFIRPANADLNMTFALAAVAMCGWLFYVLKYAGASVLIHELFGNKASKKEVSGVIYIFLTLVFVLVGFIELFSIILRPITLSFRLFGNVFGGEILLANIFGIFQWILPIPFYFLETLVGFVQAFVFMLLVSVYIGLVCNHEGGHEEAHEGEEGHAHH